MQVTKSGKYYKAFRITGPAHNFLGLALARAGTVGEARVEELSAGGDRRAPVKLDPHEVLQKVIEGVSLANAELGTDYCVESVQYVTTDSDDLIAYVELAKRITQAAANGTSESSANPHKSAIA